MVPSLGQGGTIANLDAYIEFLELGGQLFIHPYISSSVIDPLLSRGPLIVVVAYSTLYGVGRTRPVGLRESVLDDTHGTVCTHALLVYGVNECGEYLISDPYGTPCESTVSKEHLVAAIAAAQCGCESSVVLLYPK